jgi:aspartate racemase
MVFLMKTLGLLGGMSWESTREYYRLLNEDIRSAKGGLHSAPLLINSFDFAPINAMQKDTDWQPLFDYLANAARGLEAAGAQAIMICTNYMHKCAPAVEAAIGIPLLHIADAVADAVLANGQSKVGLLGARGTMEEPFYRDRLALKGVDVAVPDAAERTMIDRVVFGELCRGEFTPESRNAYLKVMNRLADEQGAQGMILGCTEIEQLILPEHTPLTLYPSAELHARAGAAFILSDE